LGAEGFQRSPYERDLADLETYPDIKDPIVDLVIAAAEPRASAHGWTP
jgi:hypothetical protein